MSLSDKIKIWRENPKQYAYERFKFEPDPWQEEALDVFPSQDPDKIRMSLQACAGPGKSAVLAICGLNFLMCHGTRTSHPKGAVVSITQENLRDNLWAEYAKWRNMDPLHIDVLEWTKSRIYNKQHPETWFLAARSWAKTADAEEQGRTLSGLHSEYVLVQVDESGDIPVSILRSGEQAINGCKWAKFMQAGNPTSLDGMLYAAATKLRHQWHVIRITGDPDDPRRSPRIDIDWAREQIENYGRDNPWVMSYILGLFPPSSINTLLGPDEVNAAIARKLRITDYNFSQKRLGVDVARFGDDRTILFPRQGLASFKFVEMRNARSTEVAARVMTAKSKWNSELEFVDCTGGYGAGVSDALHQAGVTCQEVQFAGAALDNRYFNKRSEMWFEMAEWVKRGGKLPNSPDLVRELTAPQYYFQNGKLRLEEKDQIKKRLGFSPDIADALALTFALPEMPAQVDAAGRPVVTASKRNTTLHEFDPFDESRA